MYVKDGSLVLNGKDVDKLLDAKCFFQILHGYLDKMDQPFVKSVDIYDIEQTQEVISKLFNDCYIIPD